MTDLLPTQIYSPVIVRETDKAVCVEFNHRRGNVWLPKAQIGWRETPYGRELMAPAWIQKTKLF